MAAILQIVALVLFALPPTAQAEGPRAEGHGHGAPAHHERIAGPSAHAAMSPEAALTPDAPPDGHGPCWLGCCTCHAFVEAFSPVVLRAGRIAARLPKPAQEAARRGAWPEALPEPPRTLA